MNKARTLLIDDESKSRSVLRSLLKDVLPEMEIVGEADNIEKAFRLIQEESPDLIFLDIELGNRTGFELLNNYPDPFFQVIFVTAHSEYAVKAFKYAAVDYLLKPVDPEELLEAVQRMKRRWINGVETKSQPDLTENTGYLELSIRDEMVFVKQSDVNCFEARGAYTKIFLKDGTQKLFTINLGQIEKKINPQLFFRVHRSYIINVLNVKKVVKEDRIYAIMTDGTRLEVSRRNRQEFFERLRLINPNHL